MEIIEEFGQMIVSVFFVSVFFVSVVVTVFANILGYVV